MDVEALAALRTGGEPAAALAHAVAALDTGRNVLSVATDLRRRFPNLAPDVVSAALSQAQLRRRARAKFGDRADVMWFTADGVEQATRAEVAAHRARRFAALSAHLGRPARVADLCCGIGGDLVALAEAGCELTGFDVDPLTVAVAQANVRALGVRVGVECLDVETLDPSGFDATFLDPARRHNGRRTFDVRAYSPPWPFVLNVLQERSAAVKVAPGIAHDVIADDVEAEWVSFGGELKEAVLWSGALATVGVRRRATLLPAGATLTGTGHNPAPVGPRGRYLYEPDDAVVRAHLLDVLAAELDAHLLDPSTAYLTSDTLRPTPFAQAFEITDSFPFSLKRLRDVLRARHVGAVTIMKRGSAVDVEQLRRNLRLSGDAHVVVVLALIAGKHHALVAQPPRNR